MSQIHKKLIAELRKFAAYFPFYLSQTDVMKKRAIGLDHEAKKLIYLDKNVNPFFMLVDLRKTETCSMNLNFRKIGAGELENKNVDDFIEKVFLRLHRTDQQDPVDILFYDRHENDESELPWLRQMAGRWKKTISNLIQPQRLLTTSNIPLL